MQTLINHANSLKIKPNKQAAQAYIRSLYAATSDPQQREQLAGLYTYFMPAKPAKPKTAFQWVASACSTEQYKQYLCHPYSTGKLLIATDGHRLHMAPTTLPVGWYHCTTEEPLDLKGATFPDWPRIMPSQEEQQAAQPLSLPLAWPLVESTGKYGPKLLGYQLPEASEYAAQKRYTDAALIIMHPGQLRATTFNSRNLYLTDGTYTAIICGFAI